MRPVRVGMRVKGSDHARLGEVVRVDETGLLVDKGRYFRHEYRVRREEIIDVRDDTVIVAQHRPEIAQSAGAVARRAGRGGR